MSESLMNIDLWTCVVSGVAVGVSSILVSSMLPAMGPPSEAAEESGTGKGDAGEQDEVNQEEVDAFVAEKMCEKMIDHIPASVMSEAEIREAVSEAAAMKDGEDALSGEEVNIFVILSWLLFAAVLVVSYTLADSLSHGGLTQVIRGIFPREFAFFARAADKLGGLQYL